MSNDSPPIYHLVIQDIESRAEAGKEKYGTYLQPHNGRDALMDAYQEAIDLAMYLRQQIEERGAVAACERHSGENSREIERDIEEHSEGTG